MILSIFSITVAVLLVILVLLQKQSSGLSASFGGSGGEFYRSKRSIEKMLIWLTIILAVIFGVLSILLLLR